MLLNILKRLWVLVVSYRGDNYFCVISWDTYFEALGAHTVVVCKLFLLQKAVRHFVLQMIPIEKAVRHFGILLYWYCCRVLVLGTVGNYSIPG